MGRKKKKNSKSVEDKPWCFYCDREFVDEAVLVQHQKARHFKCLHCNKRFTNSGALTFHLQQVHKVQIEKIPNALDGRESLVFSVSGMRGLPIDHPAVIARNERMRDLEMAKKLGISPDELKKPKPPMPPPPPKIERPKVFQPIFGENGINVSVASRPASVPKPPSMGPPPSLLKPAESNGEPNSEVDPKMAPAKRKPSAAFENENPNGTPDKELLKDDDLTYNLPGLVFNYVNMSPEEIRAKNPRYIQGGDDIEKKLKSLDTDIGNRLAKYLKR